jgi:hypothetical protein
MGQLTEIDDLNGHQQDEEDDYEEMRLDRWAVCCGCYSCACPALVRGLRMHFRFKQLLWSVAALLSCSLMVIDACALTGVLRGVGGSLAVDLTSAIPPQMIRRSHHDEEPLNEELHSLAFDLPSVGASAGTAAGTAAGMAVAGKVAGTAARAAAAGTGTGEAHPYNTLGGLLNTYVFYGAQLICVLRCIAGGLIRNNGGWVCSMEGARAARASGLQRKQRQQRQRQGQHQPKQRGSWLVSVVAGGGKSTRRNAYSSGRDSTFSSTFASEAEDGSEDGGEDGGYDDAYDGHCGDGSDASPVPHRSTAASSNVDAMRQSLLYAGSGSDLEGGDLEESDLESSSYAPPRQPGPASSAPQLMYTK